MEDNDYLCDMTKSEERAFAVLTNQLGEMRKAHQEERKLRLAAEGKVSRLVEELSGIRLESERMSATIRQLTSYLMGNGPVTISDSVREAVSSELRREFERREAAIVKSYERKFADMEAELAYYRQKDGDGGNAPSPAAGADTVESLSDRLPSLERQNADLRGTAYGQRTESGKYRHGCQQTEDADSLDVMGADVPDEMVASAAVRVKEGKTPSVPSSTKGVRKPRREHPVSKSGNSNDVVIRPEGLPDDAFEVGEDITERISFVRGYFRHWRIVRKKYRDPRGNFYGVNMPDKYRNGLGRAVIDETVLAQVLSMHFESNMTIGDIERWLRKEGLNFSHATVMHWFEIAAGIIKPLDEALSREINGSADVHADETTLKMRDRRLPGKGEGEDDVEPEEHYFKRWLFCYYSKPLKLTQFVSYKRGRRSREAVKEYFKEVTDRLWLHSDGAPLYKCYDVCELITRVSCLVHMRRPFFKLKDTSEDADRIVRIYDRIFHEDRLIKEESHDAGERRKQRVLRIAPLLYELKAVLDRLSGELVKEKEPELYNAVVYALKEYPCVLHCLEDGSLDLSNNVCERQIRRVAKYRNNSLFVGSPKSAERYARLASFFANIRNHGLDSITYTCDVFRRIKSCVEQERVKLLAHLWKPALVTA